MVTLQSALRPLTPADILRLWEEGAVLFPVERDLLVLAAAVPGASVQELAALSIGQRDTLLLALREQSFSPQLQGFDRCPACHEPVEFSLQVADLYRDTATAGPETAWILEFDDVSVRFRLPNSLDVMALLGGDDTGPAGYRLLERCVQAVSRAGVPVTLATLPRSVHTMIARRMAECDPLAEILLDLSCPACGAGWQQLLDPGAFLWSELEAQASRLLVEVHTLARGYGWREADILAMSAPRRRRYMEMVEQ